MPMNHMCELWEGVTLADAYTLEEWLAGDERAAFFRTSLPSDGRRAAVKLMPEAVAHEAAQPAWDRVRELRHPSLVECLDWGRTTHEGETVLYAVFEWPDDTLASALAASPLTPTESREVLDSILDGLRYLHAHAL